MGAENKDSIVSLSLNVCGTQVVLIAESAQQKCGQNTLLVGGTKG